MAGDSFLIVGLGASAGGIQAFKTFFEHVPVDSGMAYVAILHMSPEHESSLAEVLQASARIPVTTVVDRERVQPNHVYVVSPRQSLSMSDGYLVQSPISRVEERRAPVDIFFRTLAESQAARAVCAVLSGTGADGSMGLKRVKELGGVCIVQDADEAEYGDMPRNALATDLADAVLPVAEMPSWIAAYRDVKGAVRLPEEPQGRHEPDERALHDVFAQLRLRTGHDFSNYKRATVLRRVERRLGVRQLPDLRSYAAYVHEHPEEARALLKDLLISVTQFFRDHQAFERLERVVIPRLFERKRGDDQVRVWVPGCATGEEAYSIAMLLAEHASVTPGSPSVQLFATDIDEQSLAVARDGLYTLQDAADVPAERLRRFFVKEGDGYRVRKELREIVLFALHNIIRDPPFSHLDLVSCRNLLIYLNRTAQRRVGDVMHFALNPGGYLFLGTSESLEGGGDLFVAVDKEAHIFQSRGAAARPGLGLPTMTLTPVAERPRPAEPTVEPRRDRFVPPDLHQRLLERYAPPSVVVNEEHDIVHLSERAGRYLQVAGGEPTHNLIKAVRPEMRLELRTALYQAAEHRTDVEARGLALRIDDRTTHVDILVRPVLRDDDPARGYFVVLFDEVEPGRAPPEAVPERVTASEPARRLEEELIRLKAQLRTTVEQYETQAEELKASNEELQAINEELRSATEELETSKEELQSLNEELRTVNQELKVKVEETTQASNDVQNLINSTDIGTVFLDRSGRIKLFTPRARDIFNLIPTDRGRPLVDINSRLVDVDLHSDVERVLDCLERVEREVTTHDGHWYLMRVSPYRTIEGRSDGVVLTFVDITERKAAAERMRLSEERLRRALQVETVGVLFFRGDAGTDANDAFCRMSGYTRDELRDGWPRTDAVPDAESLRLHQRALDQLAAEGHAQPYEAEYVRPDGSRWWARVAPTSLSEGEAVEFVIDISESRRADAALRDADRRKNEFLATLAHELRNPLAPISTALQIQRMSSSGRLAEQARLTIERQVAHMVRLVEDLLEVSRITLGKVELRRGPVDAAEVLQAALESTQSQLQAIPHDVVVSWPTEPLPLHADAVRLNQVFSNLLHNAAKYTISGGRITVTASRDGDQAVISVRDSGMGISEALLPHVFDMFTQGVDPPAGQMQTGLGIGLTLVRTLVEAHGGRVEANSEGAGQGSEFVVRLPLAPRMDRAAAAAVSTTLPELTGWCVLVVDDNHDAADSFGMLLSMYGADVRVAYDGEQALQAMADGSPVLVFLDLGMPGLDGISVARRIRSDDGRRHPTLIALTGRDQPADREAVSGAGFDFHLVKPVDALRLREVLLAVAGRTQSGG